MDNKKRNVIFVCCTVFAIIFGAVGKMFLRSGNIVFAVLFFALAFIQLVLAVVNIILKEKNKEA